MLSNSLDVIDSAKEYPMKQVFKNVFSKEGETPKPYLGLKKLHEGENADVEYVLAVSSARQLIVRVV